MNSLISPNVMLFFYLFFLLLEDDVFDLLLVFDLEPELDLVALDLPTDELLLPEDLEVLKDLLLLEVLLLALVFVLLELLFLLIELLLVPLLTFDREVPLLIVLLDFVPELALPL